VQRRHQKIIEESLSPSLTPELRKEMSKAAVSLAEKAGYNGAGTVEFLVQDEKFYFLEMNTRLQVEHPVTEMVLGVDLVKAQILTAAKEFAIWRQADLMPRGHSIECRVYAEDPYNRGLPSTGELIGLHWPEAPGRRFEVGFEAGDVVTSFYDPMIAKIIVWDEDRSRAVRKMVKTIEDSIIFGVRANLPYLKAILTHPEFLMGTMTTQFIQRYFPEGLDPKPLTEAQKAFADRAMAMMNSAVPVRESGGMIGVGAPASALSLPWQGAWRGV
jgi:3-methylcrotonyl-CoA carboxylase alpha subunit